MRADVSLAVWQQIVDDANGRLADLHEAQAEGGGPERLERELDQVRDQVKQAKKKLAEYNVSITRVLVPREAELIAAGGLPSSGRYAGDQRDCQTNEGHDRPVRPRDR